MTAALGSATIFQNFFGATYNKEKHRLEVNNRFPAPFAIEGETFFVDALTGEEQKVYIFIPQFTPDAVFNLTMDAEGEPASFALNGTITPTNVEGRIFSYETRETAYLEELQYSQGLAFTLNSEGTEYQVTGIGECKDADLNIPPKYKGLPVTSVADKAFLRHPLNSITLNAPLKTIGSQAFRFCHAKKIILPSTLQYIHQEAFQENDLTTLIIPEGTVGVYSYAFQSCYYLTQLRLPKSLTRISQGVFSGSSLDKIIIHKEVTNIDQEAFQTVKNIYFECTAEAPTVIATRAFITLNSMREAHFTSLEAYLKVCEVATFSSNPFSGKQLYFGKQPLGSILVLPTNNVPKDAFPLQSSLTTIIGPEDAELTIGTNAFKGCNNLEQFVYEGTIDTIPPESFTYTKFKEWKIKTQKVESRAFMNCQNLEIFDASESLTLLGNSVFARCPKLKEIHLYPTMTILGSNIIDQDSSARIKWHGPQGAWDMLIQDPLLHPELAGKVDILG